MELKERKERKLIYIFMLITYLYNDAGFPIALSYPHFYKADPSILESIEGLTPNRDAHESFVYIQPQSGLPVEFAFRFQINMALQNIGHMARVEKFENFVLPLLWFEIVSTEKYRIASIEHIPSISNISIALISRHSDLPNKFK